MKKIIPVLLISISSLLAINPIQAETSSSTTTNTQTQSYGYIGLAVDTVSEAVKAQYPEGVSEKQGLIVTRFADDSPAADDGIKQYDILIAYDDEPITDPQKFIEKVRQDTPKRVAKFKLIRQGEVIVVPVTIGEQKVPAKPKTSTAQTATTATPQTQATQLAMPMQYQYPTMPVTPAPMYYYPTMPMAMQTPNMNMATPQMPMQKQTPPPADFNGLAIRKVAEGVYEASIGFIGADGKLQRRAYRGSHIEILKQVRAAKDLPPAARQQLLFALRPPKSKTQGWGNMPFGGGNMPSPKSFFKGWGW